MNAFLLAVRLWFFALVNSALVSALTIFFFSPGMAVLIFVAIVCIGVIGSFFLVITAFILIKLAAMLPYTDVPKCVWLAFVLCIQSTCWFVLILNLGIEFDSWVTGIYLSTLAGITLTVYRSRGRLATYFHQTIEDNEFQFHINGQAK